MAWQDLAETISRSEDSISDHNYHVSNFDFIMAELGGAWRNFVKTVSKNKNLNKRSKLLRQKFQFLRRS